LAAAATAGGLVAPPAVVYGSLLTARGWSWAGECCCWVQRRLSDSAERELGTSVPVQVPSSAM
jgi:hypothetical protein